MKDVIQDLKGDLRDYRSIPFWSWNDRLEPEELKRQIHQMKEMGMGGFFMHARGGLETEYLSEDWFNCIKVSVDESIAVGMNAWSYDENGWPSGFAGMKLLEDSANWAHYIEHNVGEFDEKALVSYIWNGKTLERVNEAKSNLVYLNVYERTNCSVVDILNTKVVDKFIAETHEKYKANCGKNFGQYMMGFFTDEPQYFRWNTAYTPVLVEGFQSRYGENILDGLGKLFVETKDAYAFRYKYWKMMNEFFVEHFVGRIFDWCTRNNCLLTGHAVEEGALHTQMWACAGIMNFYAFEHIPGMDWLGRQIGNEIAPKQVGSVAQQMGRKQVLTETFACCGWDVTPRELKMIAEFQYVHGVNLMCQHLMSYSIRGQRKRDYPLSYSEHTPWFTRYRQFNDYFARLGYLLANGVDEADTLVIHPIRSAYLTYNRLIDAKSVEKLDDDFARFVEVLGARNIAHHYGDEYLMERHAFVKDGKLCIGKCAYSYVALPELLTLDESTDKLLRQFVAEGGKVYIDGAKPLYINGVPNDFEYLESTVTLDEITQAQLFKVDTASQFVRSTYKHTPYGDFIYLVNLTSHDGADVALSLPSSSGRKFNLESLTFENIDIQHVHLEPTESVVIFMNNEKNERIEVKNILQKPEFINITKPYTIKGMSENNLTLDKAKLSFDGKDYGKKQYIPAIFDRLIHMRYEGDIYLKFDFTCQDMPNKLALECEDMGIQGVELNGCRLTLTHTGVMDKSFLRTDIGSEVKIGANELVFIIHFYQRPHVYYVLMDCKEGTESLKNCLSYDTELESVYLRGEFGVFAKQLTAGTCDTVLTDDSIYIGKLSHTVEGSNLTREGLLFFAGNVILENTFDISCGENAVLCLGGRHAVVGVTINGQFVKDVMFEDKVDISAFVKKGCNTISLVVYSGNRNCYGPHHFIDDEPLGVAPYQFDLGGSWNEKGESPHYRDSYSLVRFGIDIHENAHQISTI